MSLALGAVLAAVLAAPGEVGVARADWRPEAKPAQPLDIVPLDAKPPDTVPRTQRREGARSGRSVIGPSQPGRRRSAERRAGPGAAGAGAGAAGVGAAGAGGIGAGGIGAGGEDEAKDPALAGSPPAGAPGGGKVAVPGESKPAWQQTEVPDTPAQRRRMLDDLYAHLATIGSAEEAVPLVAAIERLWLYTGSDTIDVLMERVLKAVAEQNLDLADKLSATVVELAPGYAEGWNRRALVAYLKGDAEAAMHALRRALVLEPNHFKALDGVAQVMRESGERKAALQAYERLMDIHPYWEGGGEALEALKREVEGLGI